ncbi:MAG: MG2 domain-containing protein [Planctomycetota bacterium]|nr:MG2 domain-containing protein [Planctomycetota bacterium]
MKSKPRHLTLTAFVLVSILASISFVISADVNNDELRQQTRKLFADGNYKEAFDGFSTLAVSAETGGKELVQDMGMLFQCMQRLRNYPEFDELIEEIIAAHPKDWRVLSQAIQLYQSAPKHGVLVDNQWQRAPQRITGEVKNSADRDRVRALQLFEQAIEYALQDPQKLEASQLFFQLSQSLQFNGGAWRLQTLTDLKELPDYDTGYGRGYGGQGAPVDVNGTPVYHKLVRTWKEAATDGERWRWALTTAAEVNPAVRYQARIQYAQFLHGQFGVQTMANYGIRGMWGRNSDDDNNEARKGRFSVDTLKDTETIAQLATGVTRFNLPEEFNHIAVLREIYKAADAQEIHTKVQAGQILATVYLNRRQYSTGASILRDLLERFPNHGAVRQIKTQLQTVTGNWGSFDPISGQTTQEQKVFTYKFRNAQSVTFEAHRIDVAKLISDVKQHIRNNQQFSTLYSLNDLGNLIYRENEGQYINEKITQWTVELEPRENHFDRRITVKVPLEVTGAYKITAHVKEGNSTSIVYWLNDTTLVKLPTDGGQMYYVADSTTGRPVANALLDFFGFRQTRSNDGKLTYLHKQFVKTTNAMGIVQIDKNIAPQNFQWLTSARTPGKRFAFLGFHGIWYGQIHDQIYNQNKVFLITDRPVYRPDQTVKLKSWIRKAQYDKTDISQFAGVTAVLDLFNPRGEKILSKQVKTDEYGGFEFQWPAPVDAMLGTYRINVRGLGGNQASGGNTFRIEEYKKPEYEVTIEAPEKPVALGEVIKAKVQAKYYFGSPVTEGTAKITVRRYSHTQSWYPQGRWDWCFGPGYWWFCYDYPWYPGWNQWVGCQRPLPWWFGSRQTPPELVMQQETKIGSDGTVEVEIDTALAKELHGDLDHRYEIIAEVRDQSRRTIVGTGSVLATRKPFKVFTWVDRGYYHTGDSIQASFHAQTLDNRPVQGTGKLELLRLTYDRKGEPVETVVKKWKLDTNDEGRANLQMKAANKGQYRLSYTVDDGQGHKIEGGYIFTIVGDGYDGSEFRYSDIELVPDKREYKPGDTVQLQINTELRGSTVLLFVRPVNGVYLPPKMIRLNGKSTIAEITVIKKDMPNFFVEAITVANGRVFQETKEIVVPPEKRVIQVAVEPSSDIYKPGEEAQVRVKLTDHLGENFVGSTVVSIYDKSVEYISGGSNVPAIRDFFWKWRRRHNPSHQSNLQRYSRERYQASNYMSPLGVFGATVADDETDQRRDQSSSMEMQKRSAYRSAANKSGAMPQAAAEGLMMADAAAAPGGGMGGGRGNDGLAINATGGEAAPPNTIEPTIRSNFADTALWVGTLNTDAEGFAEVKIKMPENLTTWKVNVWAMGHGTNVGSAHTEIITRKNVILRMQAPRFFVEKDEVVLSANVHNYLDTEKRVQVKLALDNKHLTNLGSDTQIVTVAPHGETRVDWVVKVSGEGETKVQMAALTDEESDAMELSFPVHVHGILKTEAWAGTIRPDGNQSQVKISVPHERRKEQSVLEIRYSPTLAGAMVDALPYMLDYPYGCTEQTLNRFLPAAITQNTLIRMQLDLEQIREKRTNLNAQEIGDDPQRAKQWQRYQNNPVFSQSEVNKIVTHGVTRLTNMQNPDGGWGWFSGGRGYSYSHTTAVVIHGLQVAVANDVKVDPNVIKRGIQWLQKHEAEEVAKIKRAATKQIPYKPFADNQDALIYMILAEAGEENVEMQQFLYRDRTRLSVYGMVVYALGLETRNHQEKLTMLVRNIEQYLEQDEENETAYLNLPAGGFWWYWYGDEIETNAYYLKLLARVKPKSIQASRLVKYLLNNRKHATYWKSTRDTSLCVEAFAEYIQATGEDKPDMDVEIWVDGKKQKEVHIDASNLFSFDNKFVLRGEEVLDGDHTVELRRRGTGPVYFNVYLTNFTLEDFITKAGLEIKVERRYYKLVQDNQEREVAGSRGQVVNQREEQFKRIPLASGDHVESGDLIEIELLIDSKNDYEYLMFEDKKAAGFEAVDLRSGYIYAGLPAYREMRDSSTNYFIRRITRGKHSFTYRVRAEIPGKFSALPTIGYAMYAPELKANSDEHKIEIVDVPIGK